MSLQLLYDVSAGIGILLSLFKLRLKRVARHPRGLDLPQN
jgi:hypothetical protein